MGKSRDDACFVNHVRKEAVLKILVLEMLPVDRTETLEQISPAKIGLALTERLIAMRESVKRKWGGLKRVLEQHDDFDAVEQNDWRARHGETTEIQ